MYYKGLIPSVLRAAAACYCSGSGSECKKNDKSQREVHVTLVRHGQTQYNVEHRLQGHVDVPLNDCGREQARLLGVALKGATYHRAYSSDLGRAVETLQRITDELEMFYPTVFIIDQRLRERGFGASEGIPTEQYRADSAGSNPKHLYTPEGGECYEKYEARILEFLDDLAHVADSGKPGETLNIIIVTHGNFIVTVLRYLKENESEFQLVNFDRDAPNVKVQNTGVYKLTILSLPPDKSQKRIIAFHHFNDVRHLTASNQ